MYSYYFKDPTTGEISIDLIKKEKTKIIESENKNAQIKKTLKFDAFERKETKENFIIYLPKK